MEPPRLDSRLQAELAAIDAKIAELQTERRVLLRLMGDAQSAGASATLTPRKNGMQRVVVERAIMEFLSKVPRANTGAIFQHLRIVLRTLNPSTLRSYLHRMQARGAVSKIDGRWQLPKIGAEDSVA